MRSAATQARWLSTAFRNVGAALARGDDAGALRHLKALDKMVRQRNADWLDLADALDRRGAEISNPELKEDAALSYGMVRLMFDRHEEAIPLPLVLIISNLLQRLRRGEEPTVRDRQFIGDLRTRLRNSLNERPSMGATHDHA